MILETLYLKNFMCFSEETFSFGKQPLIIISGQNGQGKSAILDAIMLCLTSKKRSSSYSDYVKQGAEFAIISLDCEINNEPIHFFVQLNLVKGTPFQIDLHYKNSVYQNRETEEIIKSFGFDYYTDLLFTMQSDRDITELTPAERARYLSKLLNFDFDEQKTKLKKDIDQFEEIIKANNIEVPLKENIIKREKSTLEELKEVLETDEDIKKLNNEIVSEENKLKKAEDSLEELVELNKELSQINNEVSKYQQSTSEYEKKSKNIQEKILSKKRYTDEINSLTQENDQLEKSSKIIHRNINGMEQLLQEIPAEIKDLSESKFNLSAIKCEVERLEKLYLQDCCPECGQETKEFAENKYFKYIEKNSTILGNFESIEECKGDIIVKYSNIEKSIEEKEKELGNTDKEYKDLYRAYLGLVAESGKKITLISSYQELLKNNNYTQKDLDNCNSELEMEKSKLSIVSNKKGEIQGKISKIENIKVSDISKKIDLLKNKIFNYNNLILTNKEIEKRNKVREENILSLEKEIDVLKQRNFEIIKQKDIFEEAYKIFNNDLPNFMAIKACFTLEEKINNFIQNIFPTISIMLQASKKGCEFFYTKNKNLSPSNKKNNYLINAKMSSGFEKALLTLAFKVSLAELYGCNCLFLDEADGSADEDNTQILFENLINMNSFNQIFIITHKSDIKEFIENNYQAKIFEIEDGKIK